MARPFMTTKVPKKTTNNEPKWKVTPEERRSEDQGTVAEVGITRTDDLGAYVEVFNAHRLGIESGIRQGDSEVQRSAKLDAAETHLEAAWSISGEELIDITGELENKLLEMIDAIQGRRRGAEPRQLPEGVTDGLMIHSLKRSIAARERAFLFTSAMHEILHKYRDNGLALIATERNLRIKKLEAAVSSLIKTVAALRCHLIIEQSLSVNQRIGIDAALSGASQTYQVLSEVAMSSGENGLKTMLEDNFNKVRTQYTIACAHLCLITFGNVSREIMRKLLGLKSTHYLVKIESAEKPRRKQESEDKLIDRQLKRALGLAMKRAQSDDLPILPILKLFSYDTRFGHQAPRPVLLPETGFSDGGGSVNLDRLNGF